MRLRGQAALLSIGMVTGALSARGQVSGPVADAAAESRHGTLTIWHVVAVGPSRPAQVASLDPQVKSQTAGSFGQAAGSFGNAASATGQTAGSFGQNAAASSITAGSVGQSAGSFGVSTGELANAASAANGSQGGTKRDASWDRLMGDVKGTFDALDVSFEDVGADELQSRLDAAAGKAEAPDVVIGAPLPRGWSRQNSGLVRRYGLVPLGGVDLIAQTENPEVRTTRPDASVLLRAPHPRAARSFVLWLADRRIDEGVDHVPTGSKAAVAVAKTALATVLFGGEIGAAADKQMAKFSAAAAQQKAMAASGTGLLDGLKIDIDATGAAANERFAVVLLRAVMESRAGFGVAHGVVILRADAGGQWRVLQLTPNLTVEQQEVAERNLAGYGAAVKLDQVGQMVSASPAAPSDGDNRPPMPEFWWDDRGTGTLEIVEWQRNFGNSWTSSNMYFVPEDAGHLRTRTTGRFANAGGLYRWRVWSLGKGGSVAISSWRSVNILV